MQPQRWNTDPIVVVIDGVETTLREACREHGRPYSTVWKRVRSGWDAKAAIQAPSRLPQGTLLQFARGYIKQSMSRKALHVEIAEKAIGKPLPPGAEVHHVNGQKDDNRNENLVVCPDRGYHALLHRRARALEECGNANWLKCELCGEYDDPAGMYIRKTKTGQWHRACANRNRLERKRRARNAKH